MLGKAIALASEAFKEKKDKGGKPYILHCLRVMFAVSGSNDQEKMQAAILHDLLEDCSDRYTEQDLIQLGFSERVVKIISILTHNPSDSYDDYIKIIATDEDAKEIKRADLEDNSHITRLKGLRKKDFDRLEKYHRAYVYLS